MDLSLSGCGAGKARQSGSSLLFALPKRAGQKNKGRCFLRSSIRKQSRKLLTARRHLPRYRALHSTKECCSPLPCICRHAAILRCFAVLAEPLFPYVTRALGKIPQSIGRRDGAPSPLPGLGPTWRCSVGGRNPSPTKHAVQLSRYVRKCLQSFSARPANFCRVITRACVSHSSVSHIAPVKYIMRGSRHTAVTTDRMDSIPVGPLCPRTRSFRRKFPDDVHSGGHKAVTKF